MRVTGSTGPTAKPSNGGAGRAAAAGFSLAGLPRRRRRRPRAPRSARGTAGAAGRGRPRGGGRRRALTRGQTLLDHLDALRLGLLDGAVPLAALQGLRADLGAWAGDAGDARLADFVAAIDVRCAVELAKLEAAGAIG